MNKITVVLAAAAVSFWTVGAQAGGGWGTTGGNYGLSSGLINVSPSVGLGNVSVLNGIGNGNAILSGNVVSGILNGNKTNIGSGINGVLSGIGVNLFGGNSYKMGSRHH
ncbi:hypothetical protein ASD64_10390 [Mesorhizobium sp. Root157]|uniref:hypothetical protein n=1 Tax=Mesorhizobium sp. Root157 TaxID=1736477 RepID=UPI0007013B7F|nr:hypothetical protein [Mesorhizobium sp. Root157]KQZ81391.1 hypothetical protein ASD64_10390 [Mesorhizobium sp. Root157]